MSYQAMRSVNAGTSFWREFKAFIARGNIIDLGVGIVIGSAFSKVVSSFVNDLLTPPIGLFLGDYNLENTFWVVKQGEKGGPYRTIGEAAADGAVTINGGRFAAAVIDFLVISFVLFWIVRLAMSLRRKDKEDAEADAPPVRQCKECFEQVHPQARRCKYCTSVLDDGGETGNLIQP
jgi:large conductance mechanosensitive channel